jgi:hypothetical protein
LLIAGWKLIEVAIILQRAGDGKVVELTVKAMKEEDIVKLVLQADTA